MKGIVKGLLGKDGTLNKVTEIVNKSVTDKDARNDIIFAMYEIQSKNQVGRYVRALLALIIVIGCMFFGDKITLSETVQATSFGAVIGFYFFDYAKQMFGKK